MGRDDGERECPKGQPLQQQAGRAQRRQRRPDPVRRSGCERQRGRQAAGARAHDHHALAERVGGGSVGDRGISAAGGGDGGGVGLADSRWGGSCAVGDGAEGKHPICRMRVGPFQYTVLTVVDVNVLCRGHRDPCRFSSARAAADARPQSAPGPCGPHQPRSGRVLGGDALANVDRRRGAFPPPRLSCMPPTLPPSALSPAAPDLSPLSRGPVFLVVWRRVQAPVILFGRHGRCSYRSRPPPAGDVSLSPAPWSAWLLGCMGGAFGVVRGGARPPRCRWTMRGEWERPYSLYLDAPPPLQPDVLAVASPLDS